MVTHSSTSRPVQCLCMAERTGCPVLTDLWSYVPIQIKNFNIKILQNASYKTPGDAQDMAVDTLTKTFLIRIFRTSRIDGQVYVTFDSSKSCSLQTKLTSSDAYGQRTRSENAVAFGAPLFSVWTGGPFLSGNRRTRHSAPASSWYLFSTYICLQGPMVRGAPWSHGSGWDSRHGQVFLLCSSSAGLFLTLYAVGGERAEQQRSRRQLQRCPERNASPTIWLKSLVLFATVLELPSYCCPSANESLFVPEQN
jgi:hypothetical protein